MAIDMRRLRGYGMLPEMESGSTALTSNPKQKRLHKYQVNGIGQAVKEVVQTQAKNFTPKTDSRVARAITLAAIVATIILTVFAFLAAAGVAQVAMSAAAGTGLVLFGGLMIGLGSYLWTQANDRTKEEEKVGKIHDSAWRESIGDKVDEYDQADELARLYPTHYAHQQALIDAQRAATRQRAAAEAARRSRVVASAPPLPEESVRALSDEEYRALSASPSAPASRN